MRRGRRRIAHPSAGDRPSRVTSAQAMPSVRQSASAPRDRADLQAAFAAPVEDPPAPLTPPAPEAPRAQLRVVPPAPPEPKPKAKPVASPVQDIARRVEHGAGAHVVKRRDREAAKRAARI